jgi:hypothetical protein
VVAGWGEEGWGGEEEGMGACGSEADEEAAAAGQRQVCVGQHVCISAADTQPTAANIRL